jgi:hypothetical protein
MILLIGCANDTVIHHFACWLKKNNVHAAFINQHKLGETISLEKDGWHFADHSPIPHAIITGVLNRLFIRANRKTPALNAGAIQKVLCWLDHCSCHVANKPSASMSNTSKPMQLEMLKHPAWSIPPFMIAANHLFNEHPAQQIYKSISSVRSIVKKLHRQKSRQRVCEPVLFQPFIEGLNIRVHVVGDKVFPIAIDTQCIDYRYSKVPNHFHEITLPETIKQACIDVTKNLDLLFSGIDLIRSKHGPYYVLEANPAPGYAWFESRINQQIITESLYQMLSKEKNQHDSLFA